MMMDSEDHYDPYNSLYEPPIVTPPPVNPTAFGNLGSQTAVESLPTKKSRNWTLLILPAIFLFVIAGLLCFMVLWLLYRHVNFDASFGSVTNGAIIVDEAAQWCQMLTMTRTSCKSEQAPNLLGLTLSGLMVSLSIPRYFQMTYMSLNDLTKFPIEQGRLIQCHICYDYGHPMCWIELVESYLFQRNEGHANTSAVSTKQESLCFSLIRHIAGMPS